MTFWDTGTGIVLIILAQCLVVTAAILVSLAFLLYMDRKVWAAVQLRRGPNVVGPFGLFQSFADFFKFVLKEIVIPAGADKIVFMLAPMLSFVFATIAWAAIPFAEGWVIADLNVGILYIFAISSLGVYGIIMGGWASNSKYPFLGSLRSAAQMVSYEVSIGLIIIGVLISTGSLNLTAIVLAQDGRFGLFSWYWLPHLPMVVLFFVSAPGRDEPAALRPARSRVRARRRLSGRVLVDALSAVHDRRVHEHRADLRADDDPVLRRLAEPDPGHARRRALVRAEGGVLLLRHRHGEGGGAALSL